MPGIEMKRLPASGERALVHVTLNTGNKERCALVDENYAPEKLRQLKAALPKVPGFADWEIIQAEIILRDETNGHGPPYLTSAYEFVVSIRGQVASRNRHHCNHNAFASFCLW